MKLRVMTAAAAIFTSTLIMGSPSFAEDPVEIGLAIPMTGPTAGYGKDGKMGADLAAEEINAAGGILNGRKIKLVYEDEKGTAQDGVAAIQKLISQDGAKAIIAGMNSSITLAESAITRNRILHINPGAQADAITDQGSPWLFQINNTSTTNSTIYHDYLVHTLKPKSIAFMGENTEFGKAVLANLKLALNGSGIDLVAVANYDAGTTDFTSIITKLVAAKPELIYVVDAYPARTAQIWKQIRQQGGFPIEAASTGTVQQSSILPAQGAMEGVITGDIFSVDGAAGPAKTFADTFTAKYGKEPNKVSLVVYEAVKVIAGAMDKAGSDSDYNLISKTIRANAWQTPRGTLTFDAKGRAKAPYFYIQNVKGDNLALRKTFEVK
jgi:branched-chain amino acid transport system substrate-binding protein